MDQGHIRTDGFLHLEAGEEPQTQEHMTWPKDLPLTSQVQEHVRSVAGLCRAVAEIQHDVESASATLSIQGCASSVGAAKKQLAVFFLGCRVAVQHNLSVPEVGVTILIPLPHSSLSL